MTAISQVQQQMLGQLEQLGSIAQGDVIKPALDLGHGAQPAGGFGLAFEDAIRAVDAQQHQASTSMAAVDSGQSEDLVGAMIDSQKASVSFSALLQVRNKLTTAFDDIMRMPL